MSEGLSEITKICLIRIVDRFRKPAEKNGKPTYFQYIKSVFGYKTIVDKKEYKRENNYDIV